MKKKKKFPSGKELDKMEKVLQKKESSYILPPDAKAVEKAKYEICKHIIIFMHSKCLTQRQLAKKMVIPSS